MIRMGDFETPEELKQFAESRGYQVKSIKVSSKRHHFRMVYSTDEYRAIAWEKYPFESLTVEHARKLFPQREKTEVNT